jgi:hypothetical protein
VAKKKVVAKIFKFFFFISRFMIVSYERFTIIVKSMSDNVKISTVRGSSFFLKVAYCVSKRIAACARQFSSWQHLPDFPKVGSL